MSLRKIFVSIFAITASIPGAVIAKPTLVRVKIENMLFVPSELKVHGGDTIEWVNNDLVPHTVTSIVSQFDSGIIAPGGRWKFHVKKKGAFAYKCSYHPTMLGNLIIE